MAEVLLEQSWKRVLTNEFTQSYWETLSSFVRTDYLERRVYPPPQLVFNAFSLCPFPEVKVVILGQDPYHGRGQAHGLCFSVPNGVRTPPSLQNIFKELAQDLSCPIPQGGDLTPWAMQGVLLLNATLTVRDGAPGSHQGKGWETFTDAAIRALSDQREHVVFLLWGNYAKAKQQLINGTKHLVLTAAHPSPYSAHGGFFGCKHFSQANAYLTSHGIEPIDWCGGTSTQS